MTTSDDTATALRDIVSSVLRVPAEAVLDDSRLSDIAHVESIKLLRIAGRIERLYDIELDDESLFRQGTFRELVGHVETLRGASV